MAPCKDERRHIQPYGNHWRKSMVPNRSVRGERNPPGPAKRASASLERFRFALIFMEAYFTSRIGHSVGPNSPLWLNWKDGTGNPCIARAALNFFRTLLHRPNNLCTYADEIKLSILQ